MTEPRKPLTKLQFAKLAVEQKGLCGSCGEKLVFEKMKVRDEHLNPLSNGGTNELRNRALWCVPCTKPKDAKDARARAKVRSLTCANRPKVKAEIQSRKDIAKRANPWPNAQGFNRGYKPNVRHDD